MYKQTKTMNDTTISSFVKPRSPMRANLWTLYVIMRKRWEIALRYPFSFVFWFFAPFLFLIPMIIFGTVLVGSRYSSHLESLTGTSDIWVYTGIGLTFLNFLFSLMWATAFGMREEEFLGTLESLYVTPPSKEAIVLSNGLYGLTYNGVSLVVQTTVLLWLYGGVDLDQILVALIIIMCAILMIQGISMILAIIVLTIKQGWRIVFTIQVILTLFTPASFPIEVLPHWMQSLAIHSPFTIAVEGFRDTLLFGVDESIVGDLLILILWAIGLFIIGVKIFYYQEKRLLKKGSLGKY